MRHVIEAISLERLDLAYPEGHSERDRVTPRLTIWTNQHSMTPSRFLELWNARIRKEAAEREQVRKAAEAQAGAALEAGGKGTARS